MCQLCGNGGPTSRACPSGGVALWMYYRQMYMKPGVRDCTLSPKPPPALCHMPRPHTCCPSGPSCPPARACFYLRASVLLQHRPSCHPARACFYLRASSCCGNPDSWPSLGYLFMLWPQHQGHLLRDSCQTTQAKVVPRSCTCCPAMCRPVCSCVLDVSALNAFSCHIVTRSPVTGRGRHGHCPNEVDVRGQHGHTGELRNSLLASLPLSIHSWLCPSLGPSQGPPRTSELPPVRHQGLACSWVQQLLTPPVSCLHCAPLNAQSCACLDPEPWLGRGSPGQCKSCALSPQAPAGLICTG